MNVRGIIAEVVNNPNKVPAGIEHEVSNLSTLISRHGVGALKSYLFHGAFDQTIDLNTYKKRDTPNGPVYDVLDFEMVLNADDRGLSKDLALYGIREPQSTRVSKSVLKELKSAVDGEITTLEIGANIGYYAIIEALELNGRGNIIAAEPGSKNVGLLSVNVELNDVESAVSIDQTAIGVEDGEAELEIRDQANLNKIASGEESGLTETVPMKTVESLLDDHNIDSEAVHLVRMDIEGYEGKILPHMETLLTSDGPRAVFVEVHGNYLTDEEQLMILHLLYRSDYEIRAAYNASLGHDLKPSSYNQLTTVDDAFELIVQKGI